MVNAGVREGLKTSIGFGVFLVLLSGCFASPVYTLRRSEPAQTCVVPTPQGETLVGVAISGGGSRAALFGAAGLEALAKLPGATPNSSLLDDVSFISSVSGGSMATSYFATQKPSREVHILTRDGELSEEYQTFFSQFKTTMNKDYEVSLFARQLVNLRWFNPAWTAKSLSENLDEEFLNGVTFQEVSQREASGDIPHLIINTTLYNDGRRFILSTLPHEDTQYDFLKDLKPSFETSDRPGEVHDLVEMKWDALQSETVRDLDLALCPIRLSGAVAASMSFPPIIGPITFKVEGEKRYWHVGDGGLSDNSGVESLAMVLLKQLQDKKIRRALIISFDSSFPFAIGGERLNEFAEGFSLFSYDYSRIPGIMEDRALSYRALFFRTQIAQGIMPDEKRFKLIHLKHTDARFKEDLSDLPEACKEEDLNLTSPEAVVRRLSSIVTRLWVKSECDRQLVETAAAKLVEERKDEILTFLREPPPEHF